VYQRKRYANFCCVFVDHGHSIDFVSVGMFADTYNLYTSSRDCGSNEHSIPGGPRPFCSDEQSGVDMKASELLLLYDNALGHSFEYSFS